ncbi:MAG: nucleoside hydrolase [Candidatus Krumholzibacteriia bacterium]
MSRKFIIDSDTASDDAVAILMALRWPDVEVVAITIVSGNVAVERGATNALYTAQICGATVPVYMGARRPMVREPLHADWFHGADGMGNMDYPAPKRAPESTPAVDALIHEITTNPGITLVTLGPLTNVALALQRQPRLVENVGRCVVMGGAACTVGNITPAAEYNIWVDPEAARIVFHSGLPIEMVGWELSRGEANLLDEDIEFVRGLHNELAAFTADCNRMMLDSTRKQSGDPGLGLPDPVAMSVALDPTICTKSSRHYVEIETRSDLTRGSTVVDLLNRARDPLNVPAWGQLVRRQPNVLVCWEIDIRRWKEALYSALRSQRG